MGGFFVTVKTQSTKKGDKVMGLKAKKPPGSNEDFDPIEAGVHQAICIRYYDLGTQYMEKFETSARKVLLMWEVPDSRIQIENKDLPRAISKEYTLSLHRKANLRTDLESWRGKGFTDNELEGFDLDSILGANCMLNIIHKTNDRGTFANIASIMPLMKTMKKQEPENPIVCFSFDNPEIEIPENTPEWIETKIKNSEEWRTFNDYRYSEPPQEPDQEPPLPDDEVPF